MTSTIISGFLTYTLITALTPGPNNILALSSVNQYGLRRSIRVLMGMSAGFLVLMLACGAFTFTLISLLPSLTRWLVWIGAGYILWLAWRIATHSPATSNGSGHLLSFWVSFWLQFANVKIILYGITALSAFVLPYTQDIFLGNGSQHPFGGGWLCGKSGLGAGRASVPVAFPQAWSGGQSGAGFVAYLLCRPDVFLTHFEFPSRSGI